MSEIDALAEKVRETIGLEEGISGATQRACDEAHGALTELAERAKAAERERDEALGVTALEEKFGTAENYITPVQKVLLERRRAEAAEGAIEAFREQADLQELRAEAAEARVRELEEALEKALDVAIWLSGSTDFSPGGIAHEGWVTTMRPKLNEALVLAATKEPADA